jgi:hypothetical protein
MSNAGSLAWSGVSSSSQRRLEHSVTCLLAIHGVQRLAAALALLAGAGEDARAGDGEPLAAVQVAKLGADRHQPSPFSF